MYSFQDSAQATLFQEAYGLDRLQPPGLGCLLHALLGSLAGLAMWRRCATCHHLAANVAQMRLTNQPLALGLPAADMHRTMNAQSDSKQSTQQGC